MTSVDVFSSQANRIFVGRGGHEKSHTISHQRDHGTVENCDGEEHEATTPHGGCFSHKHGTENDLRDGGCSSGSRSHHRLGAERKLHRLRKFKHRNGHQVQRCWSLDMLMDAILLDSEVDCAEVSSPAPLLPIRGHRRHGFGHGRLFRHRCGHGRLLVLAEATATQRVLETDPSVNSNPPHDEVLEAGDAMADDLSFLTLASPGRTTTSPAVNDIGAESTFMVCGNC